MALYRKIDPRMWGDAKFRELSQDAKLLWIYLLTGPETTLLPGVVVGGVVHFAEALGWAPGRPQKTDSVSEAIGRVSAALDELSDAGLVEADLDSRFVWVRNAIKYNQPQTPNVILGWKTHFDNAPECPLKNRVFLALREHIEGLSDAYRSAFRRAFDCTPLDAQAQPQARRKKPKQLHIPKLEQPDSRRTTSRDQVREAWKIWRDMYAGSKRSYGPYVCNPDCGKAMKAITDRAVDEAGREFDRRGEKTGNPEPMIEEILRHWFASYLRDDGRNRFLAEARHPLRYLQRSLSEYGLPQRWSR